jgi:hypothetical protein
MQASDRSPSQPVASTAQEPAGSQLATPGASADIVSSPGRFKRPRDRTDWFEIFSRFALTLAASTVAIVGLLFQRADQQRAANERIRGAVDQIRTRYVTADGARRTYEVQAAASLIPLVLHGVGGQRRRALLALKQIAPSLAIDVSAVLRENEISPSLEFCTFMPSPSPIPQRVEGFFACAHPEWGR